MQQGIFTGVMLCTTFLLCLKPYEKLRWVSKPSSYYKPTTSMVKNNFTQFLHLKDMNHRIVKKRVELKITHPCQIELKTTQVKIHKAHGSTAEIKYYLKSVCNMIQELYTQV